MTHLLTSFTCIVVSLSLHRVSRVRCAASLVARLGFNDPEACVPFVSVALFLRLLRRNMASRCAKRETYIQKMLKTNSRVYSKPRSIGRSSRVYFKESMIRHCECQNERHSLVPIRSGNEKSSANRMIFNRTVSTNGRRRMRSEKHKGVLILAQQSLRNLNKTFIPEGYRMQKATRSNQIESRN